MKRGGGCEAGLNAMHRDYRRDRKAVVFHAHPEARVVDGEIKYTAEGPPDYFACVLGESILFDAKETSGDTWAFSNLKPHQARDLCAQLVNGGGAGLFLRFVKTDENFWLHWDRIEDDWFAWAQRKGRAKPGTASIKADDPRLIPVAGYDWLSALENTGTL